MSIVSYDPSQCHQAADTGKCNLVCGTYYVAVYTNNVIYNNCIS